MNLTCKHIEEVVGVAKASGNEVIEVSEGWTRVKQVVHMKKKLSEDDRDIIKAKQPALRHWLSERTPHNAAEEGYTCDICSVGITFPK